MSKKYLVFNQTFAQLCTFFCASYCHIYHFCLTRYVIQVYEDWSPFLENCLGEKYHEFLRLCFCCVNLVHRPKEKKILPFLGSDKRS